MDTKEENLTTDLDAGIEAYNVVQTVTAAQDAKVAAATEILAEARQASPADAAEMLKRLQVMLDGASPDDKAALELALARWEAHAPKAPVSKDDELVDNWRSAVYPYKNRMSRRNYEKEKFRLQVELLKMQMWVRETGQRVVILFEGRDAAGKGGTIKRFMEHINPRGARVVALEKPTEAERRPGISNVMYSICQLRAKSSYLTVLGITVRVLSVSWVFVLIKNMMIFYAKSLNLNAI